MTSFEMISKIKQLANTLERADALLDALTKLAESYAAIIPDLNAAFTKGDVQTLFNHFGTLQRRLDSTISLCKNTIQPDVLFWQAHRLEADLQSLLETFPGAEQRPLNELRNHLRSFWESYRAFVRNYSHEDEMGMLAAAATLRSTIDAVRNMFSFVSDNLQQSPSSLRDDQAELTIVLDTDVNLMELASKVAALHQLYEQACELLGISTAQQPLRVIKVETGSVWVKVFGAIGGITFVRAWIQAGATYVYRNYTNEGKITGIPREVEAITTILHLRELLRKANLNTDEMDNHIQKAATRVAQQLNELLADQPSITVDGKLFSIGAEATRKLLSDRKRLLLNNADQIQPVDDSMGNSHKG